MDRLISRPMGGILPFDKQQDDAGRKKNAEFSNAEARGIPEAS
jgi:hypothetical protein